MTDSAPVITFLSDYGLQDEFVGVCHAVIARRCPPARVIDISHGVPRHDVRRGALMLQAAIPFAPPGVHLAVVDPDVGAQRRAVALRLADDRLAVGPDNGLWALAAQACGGVVEAADISASPYRLQPVSATFHGRDIFAPVAAELAAGTALAEVGAPCDPGELVRLELPHPKVDADGLTAHAIFIDRFGNIGLTATHDQLTAGGLQLGHRVVVVAAGAEHPAHYVRTFADVAPGELLVYEDAARRLAVAVSHGNAAERLGVGQDDQLRVGPA